ncbi:MAG: S41 family peptidase [Tetragenococcus halophilus]|nr:S41 family peptidase [Tetragenococcus halophilus]
MKKKPKQLMKIFLLIITVLFVFEGNAQRKLKPEKLKEDFDILVTELKLEHQGLYQYTDQNQTNAKIDSVRNTLNTPHTKLEFYQKLRYLISLTNEGHTSIIIPKWSRIKLGLSKSFLPLTVKVLEGNLIITQNYGKDIGKLKKGSKIISVNHKKVNHILDRLYPLITTDGFNETSKKEWIGGINFSLLYRLVYGKEKEFELQVQEFGSDKIQTIKIPAVRYAKFKRKNAKLKSITFDYVQFKFEHIQDSIAYLSIPSFSDHDDKYEKFLQSNFKKIDSLNIKHLIIDIQANGGGTEGNGNLLFSYLSEEVIQKYKQVTMLPKPYHKNKEDGGYIEDQWRIQDRIAKRGYLTLYSDYYSDLGYRKPLKDLIYKENLYVLTSGRTFSGGAEFASMVKMTNRGLFIGEETGGTYEGNVSGYSEYLKLPNSKIKIKIPIVHFQMNVSPEIKGRGVMPDHEVPQTWDAYLKGKNAKKEFTIKNIIE